MIVIVVIIVVVHIHGNCKVKPLFNKAGYTTTVFELSEYWGRSAEAKDRNKQKN